jgi:hypothetical protein
MLYANEYTVLLLASWVKAYKSPDVVIANCPKLEISGFGGKFELMSAVVKMANPLPAVPGGPIGPSGPVEPVEPVEPVSPVGPV